MSANKIPQTAFGRASRLLIAGAKIATREAGGRLAAKLSERPEGHHLTTKIRQTQELVQALSQLRGAAMKAGQLLSLELSDLLPPEVTEVLRTLHDDSATMPFAEVDRILRKELGHERHARLKHVSTKPIASASIGQVHKAELDGKPVAIKIQFPGIAKSIDTDLALLKKVTKLFLQVQGKQLKLDDIFDELASSLKKETNYLQEADNITRYHAALSRSPWATDAYIVPLAQQDFCTRRVLTLSYETGERLTDWLRQSPPPNERMHLAHLVLKLLIEEFFVNGLVQTDPNYGNFLYRPKEGRLVLLDFGATSRYSKKFREEIRKLVHCAVTGDDERLLELTHRFGLLDPRESEETHALYLDMMHLIGAMFDPAAQPFQFSNEAFLKAVRQSALRFAGEVRFSAPAKQVIFLNRKLGGMYHLLKDADVSLDLTIYYNEVLKV